MVKAKNLTDGVELTGKTEEEGRMIHVVMSKV